MRRWREVGWIYSGDGNKVIMIGMRIMLLVILEV